MRPKLQRYKGSSLVELLVYMGLLSILLVILLDMFVSILDIKVESESVSYVEQDVMFIVAKITNDINEADSITVPLSAGDISNTLTFTNNSQTYSYSISSSMLQRNSIPLNSSFTRVTSFSAQKVGSTPSSESVYITLTIDSLAQRISSQREEKVVSFTVKTRR